MKFSQYQQLIAAAKKQIAEKLAGIQPRGGNQVSVIGDGIAVELIDRGEQEPPPPETWEYYLFGTIVRDAGEVVLENYEAARISRPSSSVLANELFWQNTQLIGTPGATFNLTKTLTLNVTTLQRASQGLANGVYRGGLKAFLVMWHADSEGNRVVDREYELNVGRNGVTRQFTPVGEDIYYLDIVSVERL